MFLRTLQTFCLVFLSTSLLFFSCKKSSSDDEETPAEPAPEAGGSETTTSDTTPPGDFSIDAPDSLVIGDALTVTWSKATDAVKYDLQIATDQTCDTVVTGKSFEEIESEEKEITELTQGTYYICVKAYDAADNTVNATNNGVTFSVGWKTISATSAPASRYNHTAIWTGSKMVIWGGTDNAQIFSDGAAYDPATDTWTAISATDAPEARYKHSAIWTGEKMIIFGGCNSLVTGTCWLSTGGIYDPAADTWTALSTTSAPTARFRHTATFTGTNMVVLGGYATGFSYTRTGAKYAVADGTWSSVSTVDSPTNGVWDHTAVWTGTAILQWGGAIGLNAALDNNGGIYDLSANTWTAMSATDAPVNRADHTSVWTGSEMVVWGGWYKDLTTGEWTYHATGARYEPTADTWTAIATTGGPAGRAYHTSLWDSNFSRMVVWGGGCHPSDGACTTYYNDGGSYSPTADTWTALSTVNTPTARRYHTAVWTGSAMIIWGGDDDSTSFGDGAMLGTP